MLEKLSTEGYATISKPEGDVLVTLQSVLQKEPSPMVAEIGVGIGATTLEMAKILAGRGEIHIFDFHESVEELSADLLKAGFKNIVTHGNTGKYWDSYHWTISAMIKDPRYYERFDLIYIDGSHTYLHDALAFFMCDRLLKVGGKLLFDDYEWRYADSKYMKQERDQYMTSEQEHSKQIKMLVDGLVKTHTGYASVIENKGFEKILSTSNGNGLISPG